MKLEEHKDLWTRIREFPIDDPDAVIKFSDKLAYEHNWSGGFTRRAIEEYKKFIFLCCISPTGASPSEIVDEVWHLHLTYTRNYWNDFCRNTLGKEIHHHPTKGGRTEKGKHQNWYAETILLYRDVFGESPPIDIWPEATKATIQLIEGEIPELNSGKTYKKHLYILLIPFLYPLLFGKLDPFALTGPQFLGFFPLLLAATLILFRIAYLDKKKTIELLVNEIYQGDANSFQLARFLYGTEKSIQAAIIDFASNRVITANSWGGLNIYPSLYNLNRDRDNPLSSIIWQQYEDGQHIKLREIRAAYDHNSTYHQGLSNLYRATVKEDVFQYLFIFFVLVTAAARIIQGTSNEKPVAYLTMMSIAAVVIFIPVVRDTSAKKILQNIFIKRFRQQELAYMDQQVIPAQFIFLGLASLAGMYAFSNLESVFRGPFWNSTASTDYGAGSSCGSSCGGSGGDGGGGGGCGGCGGGD